MAFKIDAAVCSNIGKIRKNNEDNFFFNGFYMDENQRNDGGLFSVTNEGDVQMYAICDGMGGEEGGEDASITAVRGLLQYTKSAGQQIDDPKQLSHLLQKISDTIENNANKKGFHSGTTIAMVVINRDDARIVHVGDSRVYRMENQKLTRMTVDHSEVQRMFAMGLIKEEEMYTHPKRHMISQFLGMPRNEALVSPTVSQKEPLQNGQRYLICSDGLTDMVRDAEITEILSQAKNAEDAVKQLTIAALRNGGKDNVTSICLFVNEGKKGASPVRKARRAMIFSIIGMILSGAMGGFALLMLLKDYFLQ